ncbi:FxLYD domain-containing protein [Pseudomonas sp. Marseille-Q5115]|uniref:FxLYD domain-containing protein n=1 Tax=Pseudomonas sp. Marseille-Q5115 TaxID=2866593 RepID=UPI001CE4B3FF|nr:FxLYD domain-containing protein [Pseudomonas sp. Marseille-Q5115]
MNSKIVALVALSAFASSAGAADLRLRNVQLVDAGHVTSIVGTVVNASDHMVKGGYLDLEITRKGKVVARETVEVPDMDAGQAWRIWQPVQHGDSSAGVAVRARDPGMRVTGSVVPYPGTVVAQ